MQSEVLNLALSKLCLEADDNFSLTITLSVMTRYLLLDLMFTQVSLLLDLTYHTYIKENLEKKA